jgi:hypothetical protein
MHPPFPYKIKEGFWVLSKLMGFNNSFKTSEHQNVQEQQFTSILVTQKIWSQINPRQQEVNELVVESSHPE